MDMNGALMRASSSFAIAAALGLVVGVGSARAADLGGNCCADANYHAPLCAYLLASRFHWWGVCAWFVFFTITKYVCKEPEAYTCSETADCDYRYNMADS